MCDQDAFDDILQYERTSALSRRQFGSLAAGAGLASLFAPVANAAQTEGKDLQRSQGVGMGH